jgi:cytochrome oxidase Cu insertion factor (SCO1/SenC/PrrC family)
MRATLLLSCALLSAAPALAADVGQPAPDFSLRDLDGKVVKLSDLRGRTVVLEWFNPGCPFVKASHTRGTLVGAAARQAGKGVVWLAVNSAAPGKQGYGVESNRAATQQFQMSYPVLLDESGQVGRAYGATNTPGMFVIDGEGRLAYRGAIDNSPDGERQAPEGGTLVDYVSSALDDLAAGRPVRHPETRQYGCSVKYGS